ncbi:hypothetical protein QBC34DRAFT_484465 [Podospora aff. communis PSN243]|uniref:Rhodopsin domain-containing protein n=1 Tax=Podospora aff. communis PSN243 TaxID=3040156 RepID=A0AAV9GQ36_9PEZI|nr:hypothetical protein QBC34DRAFT_484465 [Podospora aff. communis PSN243]
MVGGSGRNGTGFGGGFNGGRRFPDDDLGPTTRISVWILVSAAFIFLVMRLFCKIQRHGRFHWDDYFAIAAWFALLGSGITTNIAVDLGYGKHSWNVPRENFGNLLLIGQISVTFAICSQAWSKTSFAISMLLISDGIHGRTRIFVWFAIVSMNLLFGMAAMFFWVGCTPLEKAWQPFIRGTCWSPNVIITYGIFVSAYSGILDLVFAIIPWQIIMRMQMATKEKIGVALAMSMGVFAAAAAFIKCSSLPELGGRDFSYDGVSLVIWGNAEAAVTIMAASVPMLRMLAKSVGTPKGRRGHNSHRSGPSRRHVDTYGSTKRIYYYNKPRRDLVTMTGSTWATETRLSSGHSRSGSLGKAY